MSFMTKSEKKYLIHCNKPTYSETISTQNQLFIMMFKDVILYDYLKLNKVTKKFGCI